MAPPTGFYAAPPAPPPSAHASAKPKASGGGSASQAAASNAMIKSPTILPRHPSGEVIQSKLKERWYEYEYGYPPPAPALAPPPSVHSAPPAPPPEPAQIPVLFCHTCSECGRMRSAGFHRANPVIPGKAVVPSMCRRCEKKAREKSEAEEEHTLRKVTHIRKCTADEPCDWPHRRGSIHIHVGDERRGRRRSRSQSSDLFVYHRRSRSRARSAPRMIMRKESRARLGLGMLQDDAESVYSSPPVVRRRKSMIRIASASPPGLRRRRSAIRVASTSPVRGGYRSRRIDIVDEDEDFPLRRAGYYVDRRGPTESQTQTYRNRFYHEPIAGPNPQDDDYARTSYRTQSPPARPRGRDISPDSYMSTNAEAKLASHPMPYRILREQPPARIEELPDDAPPPPPSTQPPSPPQVRRIIREARHDRDAWYRRDQRFDRDCESTIAEPDRPRVQFSQNSLWPGKGRPYYSPASYYHTPNERSPSPPPPSPPSRKLEDLHIRHVPSRASAKARSGTPHPGPPPPPSAPVALTNSDSEGEDGAVVTVRTYKGIDENGEPVTYVEERRTRFLPEREREHEEFEYRGRRDRERMPGGWREG